MHRPDITRIAEQSKAKANSLEHMPAGYLILSAVAGVYLGFGITLIFSIGAPFAAAGSPAFKLVMGAAFGIALALVIFAGSELFTGNNMVCAVNSSDPAKMTRARRSEEHTSELQSRLHLVCRLLLEKKKKIDVR